MKILLLLSVFLCGLSCNRHTSSQIDSVTIEFVHLDITTIFRIDCAYFEAAFGNGLKQVTIRNQDSLATFEQILNSISFAKTSRNADVRIKVFVNYKKGTQKVICIDRFSTLVDEKLINKNKRLSKFIKGTIDAYNVAHP